MTETERERDKGLSSSLDKEKSWIGGYHTFNWASSFCLAGRWKWTGRNVPAGNETIYIPSAFLLSATHNLSLSRSLTNTLQHTHTLRARFCLYFLSPPPSLLLSFSLCVPWWIPGILLSVLLSSQYLPFALHCLPLPALLRCFFLSVSLYIFILQPVCIPLCLLSL